MEPERTEVIYQYSLKVTISNSETNSETPGEGFGIRKCFWDSAESSTGRNTIYKTEEATVNTGFFLPSGQMTE